MREKLAEIGLQEREVREGLAHTISVCIAEGCKSSGSLQVIERLSEELRHKGVAGCRVRGVGCLGLCTAGPLAVVEPQQALYGHVTADKAASIVANLDSTPDPALVVHTDTPFFQKQTRIVLENSGRIDPERIEEYIAADGPLTDIEPAGKVCTGPVATALQETEKREDARAGGHIPRLGALVAISCPQLRRIWWHQPNGDSMSTTPTVPHLMRLRGIELVT